jgi:hypothetical protein
MTRVCHILSSTQWQNTHATLCYTSVRQGDRACMHARRPTSHRLKDVSWVSAARGRSWSSCSGGGCCAWGPNSCGGGGAPLLSTCLFTVRCSARSCASGASREACSRLPTYSGEAEAREVGLQRAVGAQHSRLAPDPMQRPQGPAGMQGKWWSSQAGHMRSQADSITAVQLNQGGSTAQHCAPRTEMVSSCMWRQAGVAGSTSQPAARW